MFIFLTNDRPVIKIMQYGIIFLVLTFWKSIEVFSIFLSCLWCQSVRKKKSAEARPIHGEQIFLYNFIILRKNNRCSWRLNKSSKTFKINENLWVFLNCNKKNILLILILLLLKSKLIQWLKNSAHCVKSYAKTYLTYICQILKTSTISYI